jgi:xylulokinase
MPDPYLLGIDLGTGGCKVTLIATDGTPVANAFTEYETAHPNPGWSEQNPADWIAAVTQAVPRALAKGRVAPGAVGAICLDGSTHNAVLLGKGDVTLRPCIMWTDQRSGAESRRLEEEAGELILQVGMHRPTPTWTLPQLAWIRNHEPDVFSAIQRLTFTKDHVR